MCNLLSVRFDLRIKICLNIIEERVDKFDEHQGYLISISKTEVK